MSLPFSRPKPSMWATYPHTFARTTGSCLYWAATRKFNTWLLWKCFITRPLLNSPHVMKQTMRYIYWKVSHTGYIYWLSGRWVTQITSTEVLKVSHSGYIYWKWKVSHSGYINLLIGNSLSLYQLEIKSITGSKLYIYWNVSHWGYAI